MTRRFVIGGLLPAQAQLSNCRSFLIGYFGGWGSGKTAGAAMKFLRHVLENPWSEAYGDGRPLSIVVGATRNVLRDSAFRELERITPASLVRKKRNLPDWEWEMSNGHKIVFRTFKGMTEGASVSALWADEAHLIPSKRQWLNYQARPRDALARSRLCMASGLPEHGWLQEIFDGWPSATETAIGAGARVDATVTLRNGKTIGRTAFFLHSEDNPYLSDEQKAMFRASTSAAEARKYIEGRWQRPDHLIYHQFSTRVHIVSDAGNRSQPVQIGFDVGDQSHVVVVQARKIPTGKTGRAVDGLHVVDDWFAADVSTDQLCRQIKTRGWLIDPRQSSLFTDPTIRRDEIASIRRVFPAIPIVKKSRKGKADSTEAGYAAVNAALMDADGVTRLTFSDKLKRDKGSLLYAVMRFRRKPNGYPERDNKLDHASDALRYVVHHELPGARAHWQQVTASNDRRVGVS